MLDARMLVDDEGSTVCHAGTPHPGDAVDRGPWGRLCSRCWSGLLDADHVLGHAARAWQKRQGNQDDA